MKNSRRGRRGSRSRRPNRSRIPTNRMMGLPTLIPFDMVRTATFTAALSYSVDITPNTTFNTFLYNIANYFEYYRFTRLTFKLLPAGVLYAATYLPSNEGVNGSNAFSDIILSSFNKLVTANVSVPTYINIPRSCLYNTPETWYSENTTNDPQGRLVVAVPASYTGNIYIQITGVMEVKLQSASGQDLSNSRPLSSSTSSAIMPKDTSSPVNHHPDDGEISSCKKCKH